MIDSRFFDKFRFFFKECQPRILVVTDMSFSPANGFSLSQFVNTLRSGLITGQIPKVVTAHTGVDLAADLQNFKFDQPTDGLLKSKYDVCFIFAFRRDGSWTGNPFPISLALGELNAIERFMEAGGGVFATGDHEDLGAGICRDIIRVRNMRKWTKAQGVPSAGGVDRLSTMLPGNDEIYIFPDESDVHPQRVYLNWRTKAGGNGYPHPLMQASGGRAIVHIPDHPHEGECVIPRNLETTFELDGVKKREWPLEVGGNKPLQPEIVAKSMSHGGRLADIGKEPLTPREFIAIAAYDGHRAEVGRVVTDATWHHFLNINIDGTGRQPSYNGLQNPDGTDRPELTLLRQHWRNLAEWLMPKTRRWCIWPLRIVDIITSFPLVEELVIPEPPQRDAKLEVKIGGQLLQVLDKRLLSFQVNELIDDALELVLKTQVERDKASDDLKAAVLGSQVIALVDLGQEEMIDADLLVLKLTEAAQSAAKRVQQ